MPKVDTTKVGAEVAEKLGLGEETTSVTETPEEESQVVETAEPEGEEPEDETPLEQPPRKGGETIPLQRFNEVYGRMKELERTLLEVVRGREAEAQTKPREAAQLPDFDSMTQNEVVRWVIDNVSQSMRSAIQETMRPMVSSVEQDRVSRDIKETATKHTDFWDYRDKMIEIADKHPTLTAEECYQLASGNVDVAKRAVAQRIKASVAKKKAARTEMRSSPAEKVVENKEFKNIREAGLATAKKLGLM